MEESVLEHFDFLQTLCCNESCVKDLINKATPEEISSIIACLQLSKELKLPLKSKQKSALYSCLRSVKRFKYTACLKPIIASVLAKFVCDGFWLLYNGDT